MSSKERVPSGGNTAFTYELGPRNPLAELASERVDAIVCSGGTSSMNPMLLFRGDSMLPG